MWNNHAIIRSSIDFKFKVIEIKRIFLGTRLYIENDVSYLLVKRCVNEETLNQLALIFLS